MKLSALRFLSLSFLFSLLIFIFLGISHSSVQAQTYYPTPTENVKQNPYNTPNNNSDVPKNLHTYTQNVLIDTMAAVACQLTGYDPTTPDQRCLGTDPSTGKVGYVEKGGGAIGFMSSMITMLYTPPASTGQYIASVAENFGISKNTYARWMDDAPRGHSTDYASGTGFTGLKPILPIWETFRNISYLIFILVFAIIGLGIMLRLKIDPNIVMSVQNQIPKIIIGIALVTLSFAIAGFLIDVMWIAIYLFYAIFNNIAQIDVTALSPQALTGTNPIGAVGGLGGVGGLSIDGAGAIKGVITGLFDNVVGGWIANVIGGMVGAAVGASPIGTAIGAVVGGLAFGIPTGGAGAAKGAGIGMAVAPIVGGLLGFATGGSKMIGIAGYLIAFLVIAVALLYALLKVWFTLIMAYISILLSIIFAPFWIIGGLIPGSSLSFSAWVRNLLANLAAFPATILMFLLGKTFMDTMGSSYVGQFVPPLIGNPADIKVFTSLIGLGIILTIPSVVDMMKDTFKAPKLEFGGAGRAIGVGTGIAGIPRKLGEQAYYLGHISQLPFLKKFSTNRQEGQGK